MTINGAACGLKSVSRHEITFVAPPGLPGTTAGTTYPVVINNNGLVFKGKAVFVPARPDIFSKNPVPGPGGRSIAFNVTNSVHTTEPFNVRTFKIRGGVRVASVIRLYVTGVFNASSSDFSMRIRIGNDTISGAPPVVSFPVLADPGIYTVDFQLPPTLRGAGDQPVVVIITSGGVEYSSRLDDSTSFLSFL
jgi:uncharacterized protein (TIGR03437 family)